MALLRKPARHGATLAIVSFLAALTWPAPAVHAQSATSIEGVRGGLAAGGELDNYLRYLQTLGQVPEAPWSLRTFSAAEIDTLSAVRGAHPWSGSWLFSRPAVARHVTILPLNVAGRFNSGFPFGSNDGPIWAGRGVTGSAQGGVAMAWGHLSIVLDPIVFATQNQSFKLQPNGQSGIGRFADGHFPDLVDRPQRFGDGVYSKFDLGESAVRFDGLGITAGITTANQWWGPATVFPVILGNNAAGIPHVFLGTKGPTNIGIGRVQGQVLYGFERQSAFSPVVGPDTFTDVNHGGRRRFMSGLIATFNPAPVPGLELGFARYFHQAWRGHIGAAELRSPFQGILKESLAHSISLPGAGDQGALTNQLASVFGRWVLPNSGFELYAEYGHEDHNYDTYDLLEEPDHSRIAMAGFRKVFRRTDSRFSALRVEYIDGSDPTLSRHRGEGSIYIHTVLRQGHTQDGQLLGADIGVGSPAGANIAWESYSATGRTTWYVQRIVQNDQATFVTTGVPFTYADHLFATLGYERHRFGTISDIVYGAALTEGKRGAMLQREVNLSVMVGLITHLK